MKEKYITITQLNKYLKYKFDQDANLNTVYLKGEISNFKAHTRGHYYFTLKDEGSRINAVMFASSVSKCKFTPIDGMKVMVTGKVSVYEATGGYQIYVTEMLEDGVGNLYVAYEQLKKKLEQEGLFDKKYKKKIPRMPKKIGIITASTGAAIRDILTTLKRRYPIVETILFPSLVQGEYASRDIAKKIEIANTYDIDVLIVGRGGGSIEDLWPFNEEIVARAIFNSKVPVISAVGHEIDFTIADFVADLRAPTPTAAAELAVVDIKTVHDYLDKAKSRSTFAIKKYLDNKESVLSKLKDNYILNNPNNIYEIKEQKLDMLIDRLNISIKNIIESTSSRLFKSTNHYILNNPKMLYFSKLEKFNNIYQVLQKDINNVISNSKNKLFQLDNNYILANPEILYRYKEQKFNSLIEKLEVLNPMNTLKRGYAIVRYQDKVIKDINNLQKDDILSIELKHGIIDTKIMKVGKKND